MGTCNSDPKQQAAHLRHPAVLTVAAVNWMAQGSMKQQSSDFKWWQAMLPRATAEVLSQRDKRG